MLRKFWIFFFLLMSFLNVFALTHHHVRRHHVCHHKIIHHVAVRHVALMKRSEIKVNNNSLDYVSLHQGYTHTTLPAPVHYTAWHRSWTTAKQGLVGLVHKTVSTLHFSRYRLGGTYFNPLRGVYMVDCSEYVDRMLHNADPHAYFSLLHASGTEKPTSLDYYDLFSALPDEPWRDWQRVDNINDLEAGDILVFRFKNLEGRRAAGHVMIVMDPPLPADPHSDVVAVRVSDSAPSGHSHDTRAPHTSGIGIGTLLLKIDPYTDRPLAYAWKYGAPWRTDSNFAMGRPVSTAT